jgi:transcriptional regulator with XRE-family HTH domain
MKIKKYIALNDFKGYLRAHGLSYRQVCSKTGMRVQTFSDVLNGYSPVSTVFIAEVCNAIGVPDNRIVEFFLPGMLRNETKEAS